MADFDPYNYVGPDPQNPGRFVAVVNGSRSSNLSQDDAESTFNRLMPPSSVATGPTAPPAANAANPFGLNRPGPTTLAGLQAALQSAGYNGPWDQASMAAAYNSAAPTGTNFTGGPYAALPNNAQLLNQQYLTDRLQQIELPTLTLAQQQQAWQQSLGDKQFGLSQGQFDWTKAQGQAQLDLARQQQSAGLTGYMPTSGQAMSLPQSLQYAWAANPAIGQWFRQQYGKDPAQATPEERNNATWQWIGSVGDQTTRGLNNDPIAYAQQLSRTPTFARQQVETAQQAADRAAALQEAQVLGYVPGGRSGQAASIGPYEAGQFGAGAQGQQEPMQYGGMSTASALPGTPTLAARQWQATNALDQARLGLSARGQTLAESEAARRGDVEMAGLTGQYGGQATLGAQAQRLAEQRASDEQAARIAGVTGQYGGQQTLAALQAEREYGLGARAQTSAEQRAADEQAARIAGMTGSYGGQQTLAALGQEQQYGLAQRGQTLAETEAARRSGLEAAQQQLSERRYGLEERGQALTEQQAAEQNRLALAGLTGSYGGQQTLAGLQAERGYGLQSREQALAESEAARRGGLEASQQQLAERRYGLEERGQGQQYGLQTRAQTLAETEAAERNRMAMAGLTGSIGGQQTLAALQAEREYGLGGRAQTLAEQRAADEQAARIAGMTGSYGGQQTLAALQAEREYGLGGRAQTLAEQRAGQEYTLGSQAQRLAEQRAADEQAARIAGLTGQYGGQATLGARAQTLAEQQAAQRLGLEAGALTGTYGGQQTVAGRSLDEQIAARQAQEALSAAALTGRYGNQDTLAARQLAQDEAERRRQFGLSQGALTGQYGGQDTLASRQLGQQNEQYYAGLRTQMASTPRNWATYQRLQGTSAMGPMAATPTWEDAGAGATSNADWWQRAQSDSRQGNGGTSWTAPSVRQPNSIRPQDYARMSQTDRDLQEGDWGVQGIRPEDAWARMKNSWSTSQANPRTRYAA